MLQNALTASVVVFHPLISFKKRQHGQYWCWCYALFSINTQCYTFGYCSLSLSKLPPQRSFQFCSGTCIYVFRKYLLWNYQWSREKCSLMYWICYAHKYSTIRVFTNGWIINTGKYKSLYNLRVNRNWIS